MLKKYLPTICSRSLEISKEKQNKIKSLMKQIHYFLLGDTVDGISVLSDKQLPTGFSKEQNDQIIVRKRNLRLR